MSVSTNGNNSRIDNSTSNSDEIVRATVTGVDTKGQMFRRPVTVLSMDGRDCMFRSDRQPESGSSLLVEFDYPQDGIKRLVSHAFVKSISPDQDGGFFAVAVELETAQTKKILPRPVEINTLRAEPRSMLASDSHSAPGKVTPSISPHDISSRLVSNSTPRVLTHPNHQAGAEPKHEGGESLPKIRPEDPIAAREAVRSAVASELEQALSHIKTSVSSEMEKTLPGIVASNLEKLVCDSVEKQISANYEISSQALSAAILRQVDDRIAALRGALEDRAKELFEQQSESVRTTEERLEKDLSLRAANIVRSFEQSAAALETKINASFAATETILATSRELKQEISEGMLPLQQALRQLNDANKAGIEEFRIQAASQVSEFAAQFQNQLTMISTDRAALFSAEIESRLLSTQQQCDELLEKLGGALQLLQNTARVQQERMAEHSKATVVGFKKEIRSLFLHLAERA